MGGDAEKFGSFQPFLFNPKTSGKVRPLEFYPFSKLLETPVRRDVLMPTEDIVQVATDMAMTMYTLGGVGLSANQIGEDIPLMVCDVNVLQRGLPPALMAFWNPSFVIPDRSGSESMREGCLSLPGISEEISRPLVVVVTATSLNDGEEHSFPAHGALARVIQHEVDHLHGRTMLDHMSMFKQRYVIQQLRSFHKKLRQGNGHPVRRPHRNIHR
jgi:peptide deformylase